MRLKQIKLAGFKSFVDVTKVPFPHQMTAIVGPNGCGKSNIIDAVRWVLGESSAKNLRGDAMTDVIFNGSAERKPIGQASVELIFETQYETQAERAQDSPTNNFHLAANLAERNEVSIRRTVNRDGQNLYYLNGSKCRKKDITDVFLGSGLGPKSYAIIEQGMISRLIESKPQELRVFVEEAAGVSKYKERRRETELKLGHTSDNLSRLGDISQEIGIHLNVLDQQAAQASQYRKLKAQERELKSIIATVKYQAAQRQLDKLSAVIADLSQQMSAAKQELGEQKSALSKQEQTIEQDYQLLSQAQHELTSVNQANSRCRQELATAQHLLENNEKQLARYAEKQRESREKSQQYQAEINNWQKKLAELAPQILLAEQALVAAKAELLNLEQQLTEKEQLVQAKSRERLAQQEQRIARQKASLAHQESLTKLDAQIEAKQSRINELDEQTFDDLDELTVQQQSLTKQLLATNEMFAALEDEKQQVDADLEAVAKALSDATQIQLADQLKLEQLETQLAVKEEWQTECEHWLTEQGITGKENTGKGNTGQGITGLKSYREVISVEKAWQVAADKVLGHWLDAFLLDNKDYEQLLLNAEQTLEEATQTAQRYWLINQGKLEQSAKHGSLATKVRTGVGFLPILNQVQIAKDKSALATMLSASTAIHADERYIICQDGSLWSNVTTSKGRELQSVNRLALQCQYDELSENLAKQAPIIKDLANKQAGLEATQQSLLQQTSQLISQQSAQKLAQQKINSELEFKSAQIAEHNRQSLALTQAIDELIQERQVLVAAYKRENKQENEQKNAEKAIEQADQAAEQALTELQNQVTGLQAQKHVNQQAVNEAQQALQQLQLEHQQHSLSLRQTELQLAHANEQQRSTEDQLAHYQQELAKLPNTDELTQQVNETSELVEQAKAKLATAELQLDGSKGKKSQLAKQIAQQESKVSQQNDEAHQQALKKEQLVFELNAAKASLSELKELNQQQVFGEPTGTISSYQQQLKQVSRKLAELGAVNLAAIDEFQLQQSRKNQIDLQIEDLTQAVATLESAIAKIDKESRQKFKTTFEQINQGFSALFPKVFGGGQAYLTLTSDDLLDTGVTIMARPPGKKNSTIHLLSGGEKALTALSLVFAIFRLTPAPFCMLDEVDAPLDDANVERFCNLVGEMSKTVQFIYISHNKIAMEMASHLTGVTMMEPGVSRMVSVDIDEAIAMAEVS